MKHYRCRLRSRPALAVTAVDRARQLRKNCELRRPVVSQELQLSWRVQQQGHRARDQVRRRRFQRAAGEEAPEWATFDEDKIGAD